VPSIASECSGTPLITRGGGLLFAFPAEDDATEGANDADERPAVVAGITFGRPLLVAAGPANHRVAFAEDLARLGHFVFAAGVVGDRSCRIAESISGRTFDNALCCLEPGEKPVGPCFIPTVRHRSETPFVTVALETEPSTAVFARHFRGSAERVFPPLWRLPPVSEAG
jgi:hypothetical protein